MQQQNIFGITHPEFYESISNYKISETYINKLEELLPKGEKINQNDIWLHVSYNKKIVIQGFKIHVSTIPSDVFRILEIVVPICVEKKLSFKIAGDPHLLNIINSKYQARGYSGKFMTLYPHDEIMFKEIIEIIHQKTKDENLYGPYILSDKRYKKNKIVYYRYGGFHPTYRLNCDGSQTPLLVSPTEEEILDERQPYFQLPDWVKNPFPKDEPSEVDNEAESNILKDRYQIEGVYSFSNAGGVYFGTDNLTGKKITIKEARPYTNNWSNGGKYLYAVDFLEHEYKVLKKLNGLDFIPSPIDFFKESEHTFLVEENIDGATLNSYWAKQEKVLGPYILRDGAIERFLPQFIHIAKDLIKMICDTHNRGVLSGDISPRNIIINENTNQLYFIDFEAASLEEDDEDFKNYSAQWSTPGFTSPDRGLRKHLLPKDDFYALAMILYSSIVPVNNLFNLKIKAKELFLSKYIELGIPTKIKEIINSLEIGNVKKAKEILDDFSLSGFQKNEYSETNTGLKYDKREVEIHKIRNEVNEVLPKMKDYILDNATYERMDRLFPAHFRIFTTNPLNIAYGACGTILFLNELYENLPNTIIEWIERQPLAIETYPPSLYYGLTGLAYTFMRIGLEKKAEQAMELAYTSPILYKEPNMTVGIAGWGFMSISFYCKTRKQIYLDKAIEAGKHLIRTAEFENEGCFWRSNQDSRIHYGYGYGASGIGLFLLYLYRITQSEIYRTYAIKALEYDLSKKINSEIGMQWKRFENDNLLYPYWIHGNSGIGSILFRFYEVLGDEKYLKLAEQIAQDTFVKYSFNPGLFEGLAGIGEFMYDSFVYTKNESFLNKAFDIAETLLWFKIEKPSGIAYPGRWLTKISTDYGTGSAGIGLFFHRILNHDKRLFIDLDWDK